MKYLVIIQARCGSSRLPGKVMKDLCGEPMLLRMIERVQRSNAIDEVMVATTIEREDLPVVALCAEHNIRVFSGSENDVLDRFYQAARLLDPEFVVRLTGDCPCVDPLVLDQAIAAMDESSDYLAMSSKTFPDGMGVEIVRFSALEKSWREANLKSEREHVTQYIIKHKDLFACQDFVSPLGFHGDERWTVDEPEDFELITKIFENFFKDGVVVPFEYGDILRFLDANPELRKINSCYSRDEGLAKSLREDCVVKLTGCS